MNLINTILELEKSGHSLQKLCRLGMVTPNLALYRDIYLYVDARKQCGIKNTQAVTDAEEVFKVKKTTIYKAIKIMSAK